MKAVVKVEITTEVDPDKYMHYDPQEGDLKLLQDVRDNIDAIFEPLRRFGVNIDARVTDFWWID